MLIQTTLLYAGILGILLVVLAFNITYRWVRVTAAGHHQDPQLLRAEKVFGSFVEHVPFALILMTLIELKGAPASIIHLLGLLLTSARLLHAIGMNKVQAADILRLIGAQGTYLMLMIASLACIYYYFLAAT